MNKKQQDTIKINESILFGYKSKLLEAIDKSMRNPADPELEFGGDVEQSKFKVDPRLAAVEPTRSPNKFSFRGGGQTIENLGEGRWRINGQEYYIPNGYIPIFVGTPPQLFYMPPGSGENPIPDPNRLANPQDQYDGFRPNPQPGDIDIVRGVDGRYHYYTFNPGPPAGWQLIDQYWEVKDGQWRYYPLEAPHRYPGGSETPDGLPRNRDGSGEGIPWRYRNIRTPPYSRWRFGPRELDDARDLRWNPMVRPIDPYGGPVQDDPYWPFKPSDYPSWGPSRGPGYIPKPPRPNDDPIFYPQPDRNRPLRNL